MNDRLDDLIHKIYVSPRAPTWYYELVNSIVKKYELKKEVKYTKLDDKPLY